MRNQVLAAGVIIAALGCSGCARGVTEAAELGSSPSVDVPVGPMPGPGQPMSVPVDPYSGNDVALTQGRELFVHYNCYGCHGGHGGGGMGPSLRNHPNFKYGSDDAHVFASISEGRSQGMPSWGTKLPRDQIWKLVAYVEALGTSAEPSPPPPFPGQTPEDQSVLQR